MRAARGLNWIVALVGLLELIAPFVLGFSFVNIAMWNGIVLGVALIILGLLATRSDHVDSDRTLDIINALLGLWLILSPFILGFSTTTVVGMWTNIVLGIVTIILSLVAVFEYRAPTPHPM